MGEGRLGKTPSYPHPNTPKTRKMVGWNPSYYYYCGRRADTTQTASIDLCRFSLVSWRSARRDWKQSVQSAESRPFMYLLTNFLKTYSYKTFHYQTLFFRWQRTIIFKMTFSYQIWNPFGGMKMKMLATLKYLDHLLVNHMFMMMPHATVASPLVHLCRMKEVKPTRFHLI